MVNKFPLIIDILHNIRNVEICLDKVDELLFTIISCSIVSTNVGRAIGILRNLVSSKLCTSYPSSSSIAVNNLNLSVVLIPSFLLSDKEGHSLESVNSITFLRVSLNKEINSNIRNFCSFYVELTKILRVIVLVSAIKLSKLSLCRVDSLYKD